MTLFYLMTLSVCFSVSPWKQPHYLTRRARWQQIMVLCQNWCMPKVWTDKRGAQCLVFVKPHSCSPSPLHTIKTSAIQCHKPINAPFVLAWHHCFVFIKILLLLAQLLFCSISKPSCVVFSFFLSKRCCSLIFDFSSPFASAGTLIHMFPLKMERIWVHRVY